VGSDILLTFFASEIVHNDRRKEHKYLCDLSHAEPRLIADLLCDLALIRTENVAENAAGVCLTRSGTLLAEDHTAESAEVVEDTSVVILFEGVVKAFGTLRCCRVVREAVDQYGQS